MEEEELFVVSLFVVVAFPFECPLFDAFATFFFVMLFFAMIAVAPTDQQRDERQNADSLCRKSREEDDKRDVFRLLCSFSNPRTKREAPVGPTVIVVQIRSRDRLDPRERCSC